MLLLDKNNLELIQVAPFVFVVVIFIIGLLLPPRWTFLIALICAAISIGVPVMVRGSLEFFSIHQAFAVLLMFIGAGMAAQVTGELYAVTEWALLNYQRQRRTNLDLFESRAELHRSLKRSEALSDKLKEINVELENAHAAAETAKNFRGQFLANMSHELRTPLNAIIGFSETMLKFPIMYDNVPLAEAYQNDLNQIYNSGRQLLTLINDILDLAKVDAGKLEVFMQQVNPRPIIEASISVAHGLIGSKPIDLTADLPETIPNIWADENRVRQVLLNLYSNACKFTDKGAIHLTVRDNEDGVLLSLRDSGAGIPAEQLDAIFEEFRQANVAGRDPRSGAGLGLAISRQLVTLMGGRIWAESQVGVGSTFHVLLQPYHKEKEVTHEVPALKRQTESTLLSQESHVS
jgi:signal transduction histidine kinase